MSNLRFAILALPALLTLSACEDPAKDAPKATVMTAAPTAKATTAPMATGAAMQAAPAGGAEALTLDPASTVGFVGSKVTGKHEGKFEKVSGSISLAGGKAEGGKLEIDVDVASLKSDQEKLDGHLKSPDFFDVAKFPKATFKSTSVTKSGDELKIEGDLTLHGVTKKVTLTGKASAEVAHPMMKGTFVIAFSATTKINRKEFGVAYGPDAVVSDNVDVTISVEGDRK